MGNRQRGYSAENMHEMSMNEQELSFSQVGGGMRNRDFSRNTIQMLNEIDSNISDSEFGGFDQQAKGRGFGYSAVNMNHGQ